jgi:2-amino-4-hydroxy-6-hydroxymethyldihydropteridine diphosphokinase
VVRAFIGLGSNLGDRLENLRAAVAALRTSDGIDVRRPSSVYDTDPVGPSQPDFLNAVLEIETTLPAVDLLARLKAIEAELGRERGERWGPRVIDLDLLLYGDQAIETDALNVPHPEMYERAFVLVPLGELAPELVPEGFDRSGVRPFGEL